jgi:hypothetical protein
MATASGADLIASLMANAGQPRSPDTALEVLRKAAMAAYESGVLQGMLIQNAALRSMMEAPALASISKAMGDPLAASALQDAIADFLTKIAPPSAIADLARTAQLSNPVTPAALLGQDREAPASFRDHEGEGKSER